MPERIVSQDVLRALLGQETIDMVWGAGADEYKRGEMAYKKVFDQKNTTKQLVELLVHKALPYGGEISEGADRVHNKMYQLWITNIYMQYYQSNYIVTWQTLNHLTKMQIIKNLLTGTKERAMSLQMKKDRVHGIFLNNYDLSTQVFGDGKPIGSTTQPNGDGSTFSNLSTASASVNEVSIEAAVKVLRKYVDTGGKAIMPSPDCILSGTDLEFDVARLLQTEYTLGTNNNDKNIISSNKYIKKGHIMSPHIANDGSFFICTDVPNGLTTFTFKEPIFDMLPVPGKYDTEFTALDAYVPAIGDKRSIYVYPRV